MLGDGIDDESDAREREIRDEFRGGLERRAPPNRAPSAAAGRSSTLGLQALAAKKEEAARLAAEEAERKAAAAAKLAAKEAQGVKQAARSQRRAEKAAQAAEDKVVL